jgi:nitrate/nitrite transporter NarK
MNQAPAANQALAEGADHLWRKVSPRLMPLLIMCYPFAHSDLINIGIAKTQMSSDLAFSEAEYGLGAGLLFVSYALSSVPSNLALVTFGPRRWITLLMLAWSIMSTRNVPGNNPDRVLHPSILLGRGGGGLGLISNVGSIASFIASSLVGWVRNTKLRFGYLCFG